MWHELKNCFLKINW